VVTTCIDRPAHPYLQALLSALIVTKDKKKILLKDAELPSLFSPPSGCAFNPRCPYSSEICSREEPELMPLAMANEHDHLVACHHVKEIPPWGETISQSTEFKSNELEKKSVNEN